MALTAAAWPRASPSPSGGQVPDLDGVVRAASENLLAVQAEKDRGHTALVSGEECNSLPVAVSQTWQAVARRRRAAAVRTECDRGDGALVTGTLHRQCLPGGSVRESHDLVAARGGDDLAVGTVNGRSDGRSVAVERQ